jgi:hypothetical protein
MSKPHAEILELVDRVRAAQQKLVTAYAQLEAVHQACATAEEAAREARRTFDALRHELITAVLGQDSVATSWMEHAHGKPSLWGEQRVSTA